jgi:pyruvate dehydrogenase E2 component (dihydrolipoamide acetyltransferase)
MHEVIMPKMGLSMESGKIEKWIKKEGDKVVAGDIILEIMTDKVSLEVEAFESGYLRKIVRAEGEEVPVTEVIAYIGELDEEVPTNGKKTASEHKEEPVKVDVPEQAEKKGKEPIIKISPVAKKLAKELGIDYTKEKITGTGPGGRIVNEDIMSFSEKKKKEKEATPVEAVSREAKTEVKIKGPENLKVNSIKPVENIRRIISERMTYSIQNIPHITQTVVISAQEMVKFRDKIKGRFLELYGVNITYTDFFIKAAANALADELKVNSSFQEGRQVIYDDINIGFGVATDRGLVVPTVYNADKKSLIEIALERADLTRKAREHKLSLQEVSNSTFTITNLGMFGIRTFTAIINPPQAAILIIGEIYNSLFMEDGVVKQNDLMEFSLAVDHRILDGADGAIYLKKLKDIIENPEFFLFSSK